MVLPDIILNKVSMTLKFMRNFIENNTPLEVLFMLLASENLGFFIFGKLIVNG